jgi:hypothetical protein
MQEAHPSQAECDKVRRNQSSVIESPTLSETSPRAKKRARSP